MKLKLDGFDLPQNVTLTIECNRVLLSYSLNIEPDVKPFIKVGKVYKSRKFYVFVMRAVITDVNTNSILGAYNMLKAQAMIHVRNAQIELRKAQIDKIERKFYQKQLSLW